MMGSASPRSPSTTSAASADAGTGTLSVDGKVVATQIMERTIPIILPWDETFDIGSKTGTPVDDADYQVPFAFTGKIDKLDDLGRPAGADRRGQAEAARRRARGAGRQLERDECGSNWSTLTSARSLPSIVCQSPDLIRGLARASGRATPLVWMAGSSPAMTSGGVLNPPPACVARRASPSSPARSRRAGSEFRCAP